MNQFVRCFAIVTLGASMGGCDSKVDECNKVAKIVNASVAELHAVDVAIHDTVEPSEEKKQAERLISIVQKTGKELEALTLRTEGLKPLLTAYISMTKQVEEGGREILSQVEAAGEISSGELERVLKGLEEAQAKLTSACDADSEACSKVGAALEKVPHEADLAALVPAFSTLAADLAGIESAEGPVKTAIAGLGEVVKEKIAVLEKLAKLQSVFEVAEKKITDAVAAEDKIIDDLNAFCKG